MECNIYINYSARPLPSPPLPPPPTDGVSQIYTDTYMYVPIPVSISFVSFILPAGPCLDLRYSGLSSSGHSSRPASQSSLLIFFPFFLFFFFLLSSPELELSEMVSVLESLLLELSSELLSAEAESLLLLLLLS